MARYLDLRSIWLLFQPLRQSALARQSSSIVVRLSDAMHQRKQSESKYGPNHLARIEFLRYARDIRV